MKEGYINGSDLLARIGAKCVGHCSSHTANFNTETKDRAVKPVATATVGSSGLYKQKGITGLGVTVDFEGLSSYDETEGGFGYILDAWAKGKPVELSLFEREDDETPYLEADFVITSLKRTAPADDDVTYTGTAEMTGAPKTLDPSVLTEMKAKTPGS